MAHDIQARAKHHKSYLTSDGKLLCMKAAALAGAAVALSAFFVAPRKRSWQTNAQWKHVEHHRYAHRGLFAEPPSAQVYPKGTSGDPWKSKKDLLSSPDQIVKAADKVIKTSHASVSKPLWEDDIKKSPSPVIPENSLPAFEAALAAGYGIELDVRLTKDNVLVVVHDSDLERLCGKAGFVEQLTHKQLCEYRLLGTDEQIPTLEQLLSLCQKQKNKLNNQAPLIVEIKSTVSNYSDISKLTLLALSRFNLRYCIVSFDPRVLLWLRKNRPDVLRGQLSENYLRDRATQKFGVPLRLVLSGLFANVISRPDFISYRFADRHNPFVWLCCKVLRARLVTWTIRSDKELAEAEREGAVAVFEHIRPEVRSRLSK